MIAPLFDLARPLLLALEPEAAHETTLRSLEAGLFPRRDNAADARLATRVMGLAFPNPIGIAAGFDKDARVPCAVLALGCGFAECGTVTPQPQVGNPQPRVFRLIRERAIVNRLGFNNGGHGRALERLATRRCNGIVAINIGANKSSSDRAADYEHGLETFQDVASYIAVNISSPNTPRLRDLQAPAELDGLLSRVMSARAKGVAQGRARPPIVVKIAPDIAEDDLAPVCERLLAHGVDGIAVSNTTLTRPGLANASVAKEPGGLSGRPLFHRSTVVLARVHRLTGGRVPLIGIGGIDSGETALAKIEAGASLIQLYTGLVYEGPGLIARIADHLGRSVSEAGARSIGELTGRRAELWADRPIDG